MATSNPYGTGKYKTNVGRAISKKWKDLRQVNYEGSDWGEDEEYDEPQPVSADNPRHPAWGTQSNVYPSNRSFTSPSPSRADQRPSFDRGDERRHLSSSIGFESAYPTTQRSPFPEPQHDDESSASNYGMQAPLRLNTQAQAPMHPGGFRPGSRGRQYPAYEEVPFSAPGSFPQQNISGLGGRPPFGDVYQRRESPMRPDSRSSNASHRQFPPRKASLSQQSPQPDLLRRSESPVRSSSPGPGNSISIDDRPPPVFIRPSDIYKRMPEEMEKVRKSQESSRPSVDSATNPAREGSIGGRSTSSDPKEPTGPMQMTAEDSDSTRRLKPTLDTVPERKSEYGFDNLIKIPSDDNQQPKEIKTESDAVGVSRHDTTASSVYTDRPDPVSASPISRNISITEGIPETDHRLPNAKESFGLPLVHRTSGFDVDLGALATPVPEPTPQMSQSSGNGSPPGTSSNNTIDDAGSESKRQGLQHQPTLGYRSVVQQAFDQSENQSPFSPTSTAGTVGRSNSASTTDISPIMSHRHDPTPSTSSIQTVQAAIPEESAHSESRPTSTNTLKAVEMQPAQDEVLSPPPPIRPGYRRDITPPSRDNSPAKKPREVGPREFLQPQHGSLVDDETRQSVPEEPARGRVLGDKPLPAELKQETGPASTDPALPRSGTPSLTEVHDPTTRLESSPVRSAVTIATAQPPPSNDVQGRPSPQMRLESFRPAIPGGWQSYASSAGSATPGTSTPLQSQRNILSPQPPFSQSRVDSTESIPTARAPVNLTSDGDGVTQKAFAAAASAGSALAGALAGHRLAEQAQASGESSSEDNANEWDASSSSSGEEAQPATSDMGPESQRNKQMAEPGQESIGKRTSSEPVTKPVRNPSVSSSTPSSTNNSAEAGKSPQDVDYIPAPLRTSRLIDTSSPRPPIPNVSMPQDTPTESDNERLQQEIVKSLTPKSSNLDGQNAQGSSPSGTIPRGTIHQNVDDPEPGPKTLAPLHVITPRPIEPTTLTNDGNLSNFDQPRAESTMLSSQTSTAFPRGATISPSVDTDMAGTSQTEAPVEERMVMGGKPFLQQRFSWETGSSQPPSASTPKQMSPPSASSPDTITAQVPLASGLVDKPQMDVEVDQPIARQATLSSHEPIQVVQPSRVPTAAGEVPQSPRQHDEPPTFRTILNLGTPAERIKAFNDSRQYYATPDEQLGNWLMSMKTPENSELFATNGRLSLDRAESINIHKPSPRRMLTESAGHMQEDGKRLMAAAGRFGGKAGTAAKGLFAKGKEKMRHASSGEKGTLASRRKSTGPLPDEPEDVASPSQPRDSTSLDGPPQIPLSITPASPIDWFSNPELKRSRTSDLDQIRLPQTSTSPTVPESQVGTRSQLQHANVVPGGDGTSSITPVGPVLAPSPAISALDSEQEHNEDDGLPSRSISQLTRPTDQSPIESPHQALERSKSHREDSTVQPQVATTESRGLDPNALAAPKPFTEHHEGSASEGHSSDRSLQVPQLRRRSVISDVSSASPSPGAGAERQYARRSVSLSPADEAPIDPIAAPYGERVTQPEKPSQLMAAEAAIKQPSLDTEQRPVEPPAAVAPSTATQDELPNMQDSKPRTGVIEPDSAGELPDQQPASHHEQEREQYLPGQRRPFSFAGIEGIGAIHQSEQMQEPDLSRIPSQPLSPISQGRSSAGLSKEMSQVSVEEITDQANAPGQRHSRSYSRPFAVDPNIGNHPALRAAEPEQPPLDRAQMYSTESPLPSARRPQEELDRLRQQKEQQQVAIMQQHQPSMEEEYRIPGPYVQEYRSPKQISAPRNGRSNVQVLASGKPLPSALRSQQYPSQIPPQPHPGPASNVSVEGPNRRSYQEQPSYKPGPAAHIEYDTKSGNIPTHPAAQSLQHHRQSMNASPAPAVQPESSQPAFPGPQTERKKSMLGKLFGVGSQSRSRLHKQGRVGSPIDNTEIIHKEKRGSFLRRNDSMSSEHSGQHGRQDHLGQLPSSNIQSHSARRQSKDVLRAPTPETGERVPEGKKKRFSGFGGNLFKSSSNNTRAATAPTPPSRTTQGQPITTQRVISPDPYSAQSQRVMSPDPYSAQTPYGQYPAGPGGYFHQGPGQSQYPQSTYPLVPSQSQPSQYPKAPSPYQHQSEPTRYPYPGQIAQSPPPGQQQAVGSYPSTAYPYMNPNQSRPSDLRIDTSSGNRNQYYAPATAPAQGYSRPLSFASAPYNPNPSPGMTNTAGPTSASPGQPTGSTQQEARTHVIDLHKRSRSPRLGRPASDDLDSNQERGTPNIGVNNMLGTFSSKKISPVGGIARPDDDQERPFAITVPGLEDEGNERRKKQLLRERIEGGTARSETPVSVESGSHAEHMNTSTGQGLERNVSVLEGSHVPTSPREARRSSARDKNTPGIIAELPGSKAEGYESEEEIPMSATAYPGQEWMPVFVGDD
ncbi:uncharacterized protein PV07_10797 [Cladophialophora immunda]|uniref:Uncharacterized protein n=1 Tax=Cladophialophora immunda TaxID=569365 RepID=A0A0D2C1E8_9EURO|nr:uncharacterized protein PV07_10797 [Cladophialophora immunda]KIW25133.1 hypothetical protein PV07_10797 [Cladophialophora immunda]